MKLIQVPQLPVLENEEKLSKDEIKEMLECMILIRQTENKIAHLVEAGEIRTPCHLYMGQEACAVGVCYALEKTDYVFSNHRSHGHFLAKGGNISELFSEIFCKETGCSGGRGGSMHLCDPSIGFLGSSSIVAGGLGIGLGPALKSRLMKENSVSVIFHGDCVPEEGIWHESLNFAAVKKLPVIYVCENNLYAASASIEERRVRDNISEVACAHGLPTQIIDGNDLFAVHKAAVKAVERARNGEGPQFIELRTYRWLGHVGYRDDIDVGLRNKEELEFWKKRCPIDNLENYCLKMGIFSQSEIENMHCGIESQIDKAVQEAKFAKMPLPDTLLSNVYAGGLRDGE